MDFTGVPFSPTCRRFTFRTPGLTAEQKRALLEFEEHVTDQAERLHRFERFKRTMAFRKTGIRNGARS